MFTVTRWLLMSVGAWTLPVEPYLQIPYKIYQIFIWSVYFSGMLGVLANIFIHLGEDNERTVEAISHTLMSNLLIFKMLVFMGPRITRLVNVVMKDEFVVANESLKTRQMVLKYKKFVRWIDIFSIVSSYTIVYFVAVQEGIFEYLEFRKSHPNSTEVPEHLLMIWTPFDMQKHFPPLLKFQTFLVFQIGAQNYASIAMYITLMIYTILKLKILQHSLENFSRCCTSESDVLRVLNQLAREHQSIISFVQEFHNNFKVALFIEYTASSLILASTLIQIIKAWANLGNKVILFFLYASLHTFQLFLLSWNSEEIRSQSLMIGTSLYNSDWYSCRANVRRFIYFMMLRSSKPLTLNIGPFGPNTIEAAMARVKMAYSYVTVMSS